MYKHLLLPTDGSALSRAAVKAGIAFARDVGATVTGIHVISVPPPDQLEAWMHHDAEYAQRRQELFEKFARTYLDFVTESAQAQGVPCTCKAVNGSAPYLAIVTEAQQEKCDLIFLASHGWRGDGAQAMGSETLKILLHSPVPVLVHKPGASH